MGVICKYLLPVIVLTCTSLIPVTFSQTSATSTCGPNQFRCPASGFCIRSHWVCDGDNDCGDFSDERQNCPQITCSSTQFTCGNGHCVPTRWKCDFDNDCGDNSDERSCNHPACTSSEFRCATGQCIPQAQACDRIAQCSDLTDESNCTSGAAPCPYPMMQCTSGECVHFSAWCDQIQDCSDGSDEHGSCVYPTCAGHHFTCDSGECIHDDWVCDGGADCMDESDEQGCNATFICPPQQWACAGTDHQCIPESNLCDGRPDCPDRTDEQPSCNIANCGALGCSYQCRAGPYGGICTCTPGYVIGSDNRTCTDFNECNAWGFCDQLCENSPQGSYTCSCVDDSYTLEIDGHCRSNANDAPFIMYAMGNEIIRANIYGNSFQSVVSDIDPMDIDYHFAQNKIYWTDPLNSKVYRANFFGGNSNPEVVISLNGISPENVAVDWVGRNLYFMESNANRIEVCKLDGSKRGTLIGRGLQNPKGLALDPTQGYMFFSDLGGPDQSVQISKAFMDGTKKLPLVTDKLHSPTGITVDIPAQRIYWVDNKFDRLETINYNGQYRQIILSGAATIPHPYSVAVFERNVYVTDWTKLAVLSSNRFDLTQGVTELDRSSTDVKPYGIKVVHSSLQPAVPNPCGTDNGGCSQLCVVSHRTDNNGVGYRCMCSLGYSLERDGTTCTEIDTFLLYATPYLVRGTQVFANTPTDAIEPIIEGSRSIYDVEFDARGQFIFYIKLIGSATSINRVRRNGTELEAIMIDYMSVPRSMTFDWLSRNLYWPDWWYNQISVIKIDDNFDANTAARKESSSNYRCWIIGTTSLCYASRVSPNHPTHWEQYLAPLPLKPCNPAGIRLISRGRTYALTFDWLSRSLYWADMNSDWIAVVKFDDNFDGDTATRKVLVTDLLRPKGIAVAPLDGYLFWMDVATPARIERSWTDGTHRQIIVDTELGSYGASGGHMAVDHQSKLLFWVENQELRRLERCNFDGTGRQQLNIENLGNPFGIAVFKNYTYYSDLRDNKVYRINKWTGQQKITVTRGTDPIYGIRLYSTEIQSGENSCSRLSRNGGCTHFCFPAPNNERTCGCPDGMRLTRDQATCENDPDYVPPPPCRSWHFECGNQQCITYLFQCDGEPDCSDESDEVGCGTDITCSPFAITCGDGSCLSRSKQCDGNNDCNDASDEENCPVLTCGGDNFQCPNGRCIPRRLVCNTDNDCGDAADEQGCAGYSCDDNHFSCESIQACVPLSWVCNGNDNCGDNSDEIDCPRRNCTGSDFWCSNGECVRGAYECDRFNDCSDGSDEENCPPPGSCNEGSFLCPETGSCLPNDWMCDGHSDCIDGTDEPSSCLPVTCRPTYFQCASRNRCIPSRWLCDLDNDCGDNSDEQNCPTPPYRCPEGNWQCPRTTQCILDEFVCDGQPHCPAGDDEGPLCNDDVCNTLNGGCSHTCLDTPHGALCQCPNGLTLNGTKTCIDIDECNPPLYCSQLCTNTRASFECGCVEGYFLDGNGMTCKASGDTEALILVSNRNRLYSKSVTSSTIDTLVSNNVGPSNIVSIEINTAEDLIYWGDSSTNTIWKTDINGTNNTAMIDSGLDYSMLAYDWVTNNLYWADPYLEIVEVVSLDTLHRATILSTNVTNIRGFSLDPRNGKRYMFWGNRGINANPYNSPMIERLSMDGTERTVIVSDKIYSPNGLALDLPTERVFFGDDRMDFIESCDYDGNRRQQVIVSSQYIRYLQNMVVWEDYVYWIDRENEELLRVHKLTGQNRSVVISNLNRPWDVKVYHPNRQPPATNPCVNQPCDHLCLLSSSTVGYSCACGAGFKLNPDGVSCQVIGPFLLTTANSRGRFTFSGWNLDPNDVSRINMVHLTASKDLYDIDFDMRDGYIYWTEARDHEHQRDRALNNIQRIKLDGENRTAVVPSAFTGSPLTLAIDWVSRNIYWTNPAIETIEVMKMDGEEHYRKVVLSNEGSQGGRIMGDPVALCVDPGNGMLYWADNGDAGVEPHLAKSKMDGSDPTVITSDNLDHVDYLIIDIPAQKLYWNDATYQKVEMSNTDGSQRTTLVENVLHGRGLAVYQNFLYYSESGRQTITRIDKTTGANPVIMLDYQVQFQNSRAMATGLRVYAREGPSTNACSNNNGGCQHLCLPNGLNSKTCACTTGYQLNDDGITCANVTSFAVISSYYVIRGFGLDNGFQEAMVPCAGYARHTLHVEGVMGLGYVYFADYENRGEKRNGIRRVRPDGSGLEDLVLGSGNYGLRGLAIDWVAGNMYFPNVHSYITYLEVSRLDGTKRRVLWKTVDEKPRTMAVNPIKKYIYWADYGQSPSITRAYLDASNQTALVTTGISLPRDICIDINTHKVYWVDSVTGSLERIDWDGSNRQYIRQQLPNPHGLAIFLDKVYWVDRSEGYIYRASKEPGNNQDPEVLKRDISPLRDIAIYDYRIQPDVPDNPCSQDNGGCEDLCVALPDGERQPRICMCAYGQLGADGTSCEDVSSYLVYAQTSSIRSLHLDETNHAMPFQPITGLSTTVALDFDYGEQRIFFTDVGEHKIKSISASGSGTPVDVVTENIRNPEGISVDWRNNRLYWTDQGLDAIFTSDFSGGNRVQLLTADVPRAIIVDPCSGMMYWTDWGEDPKIEKASMAGRGRRTLVGDNVKWPNGLTIDYDENMIYWADGFFQVIERVNFNGSRREVIIDRATHPFAMTLFQNYIYYTDWELRAVIRAEKHTGANEVTMWRDSNAPRPMDIHVYHMDRQQQCTSDPCATEYNGGCSDICHPGPSGAPECSCPVGKVLANENRMCVPEGHGCESGDFVCANGECINYDWRCDLDNDCGDNSDEADNFCYNHRCTSTQWPCDNGLCIPSAYVCDYENDCRDNSDEQQNCGFPTCVPEDFTCPNSRCIPLDYVCDGEDDCLDGNSTDERNCPETTCPSGYVQCPTSSVCIFYTWACDGDNDCGDNSDESELFCHAQDCPESAYKCSNGACIPSIWLCDDEADCTDGADEDPARCTEDRTCPAGYFTCNNGNCIPESWKCDTDNDCGDNSDESDELNCEDHTCDPEYFTCAQNRPGRTRCIPRTWICDGDSDCEDGDDEHEDQGCTRTSCEGDYFTCDNQLCIPQLWYCDHDNDCGDSSDEGNFCEYPECDSSEFACNNGRCIPASWQCDEDNDCRDNSDEIRCVTEPPTCPPNKFQCANGVCIDNNLLCNKADDCGDGSDETRCGIDECAILSNNQCEYDCVDTTNSYYCTCQSGYTLNPDELTCRDINECNETAGICSQFCENIRGAYICKCADGYAKEPDGRTCKQTSEITPSLLFTNRYYIRKLAIDGSDYSLVADGFASIVSLDYDYKEEKIYFSDTTRRSIMTVNIDGTNMQTLFDSHDNIPTVQGLGIDWVGRKMYWTDSNKDMIEVSELDGTNRMTLHHRDLFLPRAIAIDPRDGLLFWTDWGLNPYIGRIGLDGSNPMKLDQITKLVWPNGLTIYYPIRKLFWIDAHLNYIGYANYDGSGFGEMTGTGDLAHPFAVSIFEDDVFWTDWNDMAIHKADKWTLANKTVLVETLHRPMDIKVYHPYRQNQSIPNPCGDDNGGCSHLCLLKPGGGYTCKCPNNFNMNGDGKTCSANCNVHEFLCQDLKRCIPIQYKCDNEPDCLDASDEPADCPVRHCPRGQLQCDNLNCTYSQYMCDGDNDCGDNTDEKRCEEKHCQPWEFMCNNGRCILHTEVCDQTDDCRDNSDEDPAVCLQRTCSPGYFQCDNGFCIPESWYCDIDNDCGDNSDEPHRICQSQGPTCQPGWEKCSTNYRCIPSWAFCDGYDNCRDNSDESNCHQRTCVVGEFQCNNHKCIPGRWQCDHDNDCGDGSDEEDCTFRGCSESEWRCPLTARCIPGTWVCDHDNDCGDGTDEAVCINHECIGDNRFQCESGHCINADYVCDGDRDCQDMSDELNCGTRIPGGLYCPANEFTCNNHLCVPRTWRCDGDDDCGDGSDEGLEICYTTECDEESNYHCANRKCIPNWRLCDGVDNCGDGSDENNHDICSTPQECTEEEFKCANNKCIAIDLVCNDYDDCGDQTDEKGCHKGSGSCATAGCEELCTDIEGGYYCSCGVGLEVTSDRTGCQDIDECQQLDTCTQLCRNIKGSYSCSCAEGYADYASTGGSPGTSCKASGRAKRLLFSDGTDIRVYDYANNLYTDVVEHEGRIDALDYSNTTIFWVDSALRAVKRTSMPPEGAVSISDNLRISDLNHPQDIAVDWVGENIYWTDQGDDDFDFRTKRDAEYQGPRISVAKTDGRYVKMLVINDLDKPSAIAVNPRRGVMYWTDYGATPKIEMAYMDGSNRKTIVSDRLGAPTGLSIDFASQDAVYFCDMKESLIEVMSWNGTNRKIILSQDLENPFRIDVFETSIYWITGVTATAGKVKKQDKLGRGIPTTEIGKINLPKGIKVYQQQRYYLDPPVVNPCKDSTCSHLCLIIPGRTENRVTKGYACSCPDNDRFQSGSSSICEGVKEEPRPLPSTGGCKNGGQVNSEGECTTGGDPDPCQCQNGGTCDWGNVCVCLPGYYGPACESKRSPRTGAGPNGGVVAGIIIIIFIILVAVIALLFYYVRRRSKYSVKESTEGPVSYRGGTNIDLPGPVPMGDSSNGTSGNEYAINGDHQPGFQNPVYETSVPQLQAVGGAPEKTGLPNNDIAVAMPEKMGPPEGGIDASMEPMPEVHLPPPQNGEPPSYTATEAEGDTNVLVTKDKM